MDVPTHLQHKPIIGVKNYDVIDNPNAPKTTDAQALSIGQAQYNLQEFSAKVFRYKNKKWMRQSEELPIHRVLDLAILVVSIMNLNRKSNLNEEVINEDKYNELMEYYEKNTDILQPRLDELKSLLNELDKQRYKVSPQKSNKI